MPGTLALADGAGSPETCLSLAGGGIAKFGTLTVISSTIALNSVASGGTGGGIETANGSAGLYDTIVAGNTSQGQGPSTATYNDIDGTVAPASSFNVIGSAGSGGLTNSNSNLIISDINAGLDPLANNGSPANDGGVVDQPGPGCGEHDDRRCNGSHHQPARRHPAEHGDVSTPGLVKTASHHSLVQLQTIRHVRQQPDRVDKSRHEGRYGAGHLCVVTTTVATPVAVVTPLATKKAKAKAKVKLKVVTKKVHPGGGSTAKFHKATSVKAVNHVAVTKAHPAAHAKKK